MAEKHIALPLKYRPMTFEDVVGQEHVVKTLRNAIESKRIANAYLFIGPRGIGKTTMSRIFAKALNCSNPKGVEPCGECENCREIAAGNSLDVTELDAASHNKVEDVKPIIEAVQFKPTSSRFKIFIIDECHMLSNAAWNALLKTLEEPPEYVRFIFATTEGDKVLATIISRCQRFDLRRILTHDIVSRLKYICEKEGVDAEEDALLAIARGAEGGMRDALSSLDQLISFKGMKITEEDALGVFGLVSRSALEELAGAILKGDTAKILSSIELFDSAGKNMRRLAGELLAHFRNLVVLQALGPKSKSLTATEDQIKVLSAQAEGLDPNRVFEVCDQIAAMEDKLRYVLSVRTLIEMSLIRASKIATTATISELMKAVRKLKGQGEREETGIEAKPSVKVEASKNLQERPIKPVASHSLPSLSELSRPAPKLPSQGEAMRSPAEPPKPLEPQEPLKPLEPKKMLDNQEILNDPKFSAIFSGVPGAIVTDIKVKHK